MRRLRIKVSATVPARRKIVQSTVASTDISTISDKEQVDDVVSSINISGQEAVKDTVNIKKETITKEQNETNLIKTKPIEKLHCHKLCILNNKPEENDHQLIQKYIPPSEGSTAIDTVSTKITQNRSCFMRPTPRLDTSGRIRKNSIQGSGASASESEDEHGLCNQSNSPGIKTTQKRRILVSESARKLAEARREFLLKHENRTPDRSQLKMYDLIYYNPMTNPMKKTNTSTIISRSITPLQEKVLEKKDENDPSAMPAPQVKVGPDGQLIIDEQSLVIEQTGTRKNREILAQEAIVDDGNHSGGFYKKRQKSKEWPKWETFKFYRALNIVGTDFLLMQSLFPNRTRQQIKQKYKKEERVNRHLVEKALKYHQEFDTEMLEEQLAMLQKLENIQTNVSKRSLEKDKNGQRQTKIAIKRRHRFVASSIAECEVLPINDEEAEDTTILSMNGETDVEANSETSTNQRAKKEIKRRKTQKNVDNNFDKSDDSNYANSDNSDSGSEPEFYRIRPTRSGRLPKVKKLRGPDINTLDSGAENELLVNNDITTSLGTSKVTKNSYISSKTSEDMKTPYSENITTVIPDINQIEPGSLVILSKESAEEPGNTILQVYMVSSNIDGNATVKPSVTPIDLSPELLSTVTSKMEDVEPINVINDCE